MECRARKKTTFRLLSPRRSASFPVEVSLSLPTNRKPTIQPEQSGHSRILSSWPILRWPSCGSPRNKPRGGRLKGSSSRGRALTEDWDRSRRSRALPSHPRRRREETALPKRKRSREKGETQNRLRGDSLLKETTHCTPRTSWLDPARTAICTRKTSLHRARAHGSSWRPARTEVNGRRASPDSSRRTSPISRLSRKLCEKDSQKFLWGLARKTPSLCTSICNSSGA